MVFTSAFLNNFPSKNPLFGYLKDRLNCIKVGYRAPKTIKKPLKNSKNLKNNIKKPGFWVLKNQVFGGEDISFSIALAGKARSSRCPLCGDTVSLGFGLATGVGGVVFLLFFPVVFRCFFFFFSVVFREPLIVLYFFFFSVVFREPLIVL